MIGEGLQRAAFAAFVLAWTGRDLEYHERNQTAGMLFAWECWKEAQRQADAQRSDEQ